MANSTHPRFPARRFIGILALAAIATMGTGLAQAQGSFASSGPITGRHEDSSRGHKGDRYGKPIHTPGDQDNPGKPVPEPGTMALAGMGLVALGGTIRKRFMR
jgi:hypothetical protein